MEEPQTPTDIPVVSFKKRNAKARSTIRKRVATPPAASDSESGFTSSEDEEGRQIKRRRKNAGVTATSSSTRPTRPQDATASTPNAPVAASSAKHDATKASNWYDEQSTTTPSHAQSTKPTSTPSEPVPDGTYKGTANYQSFIQKNPSAAPNPKVVGPVKYSTNVRTITVTDFAPDVCKDYKQTGYCGFGDSCKFLHAREDYKQGWQLDRDWEINTKGKAQAGKTFASANRNAQAGQEDEDDEKLLESIPFACIICKKSYTHPIVTKCGHYFCEACALKRYRKDPSCAACGAGTGGVFNVAKKLNSLLERKRQREEQREEEANGEDK